MNTALKFAAPLVVLGAIGIGLLASPAPAPASADELAEVAVGYFKGDKAPLAWQTLQEALAADPRSFRALYVGGLMAFKEKRPAEAEAMLKKAAEIKPHDADTLLTLGAVYHSRNQYQQAVDYYNRVHQDHPKNTKAIYNLGMVAYEIGRLGLSEAYLKTYLKLAPDARDRHKVEKRLEVIAERIAKAKAKKLKKESKAS